MHILLIEPDRILADIYRQALETTGHSVTWTHSAQAAVHMADERMPDAVVLELQLARHNGVEFLYEFRSYHEWLHIPIIIHSFVSRRELELSPTLQQELGVVQHLHKSSTTLETLLRSVNATQSITAP